MAKARLKRARTEMTTKKMGERGGKAVVEGRRRSKGSWGSNVSIMNTFTWSPRFPFPLHMAYEQCDKWSSAHWIITKATPTTPFACLSFHFISLFLLATRELSRQVTGYWQTETVTVARCQMKNERDNYRNWPVQNSHKVLAAKKLESRFGPRSKCIY